MKNYKWVVVFVIFIFLAVAFFLKTANINLVKNYQPVLSSDDKKDNSLADDADIAPQVLIGEQVFSAEVAIDPAVQKKGLSGRESLPANNAMLFVYPSKKILTFWMLDMRFDIDLLWINDDKIVGIEKNMPAPAPGTEDKDLLLYSSQEPVNMVLELNSGLVDKYGIKIGDKVVYKNINF